MERVRLQHWIDRYVALWRTSGTADLDQLFTVDASYLPSPWALPVVGLAAIAEFWESERDGPDETFVLDADILACDGDLGVVRVEVNYPSSRWRDLWLVRLDAEGSCTAFEEWPFAPDQPDGH